MVPGDAGAQRANGFGALRLLLALGIVAFHSYTLSTGGIAGMAWQVQLAARLILPAFFALSGFLVAGSLARCHSPVTFIGLRLLRLLPALAVVVMVSALIAGPLLSHYGMSAYFSLGDSWRYLLNVIGLPHYGLPGVFLDNVRTGVVNGALWTIPLEIECYGLLVLAALPFRGTMAAVPLTLMGIGLCIPGLDLHLPAPALFLAFICGALLQHVRRFVPRNAGVAILCLAATFWMARRPDALLLALPLSYAVMCLGLSRVPSWLTRADYSYGIYLVGFPVEQTILAIQPGLAWWATFFLSLPLILLIAALLWHLVECPLLKRKQFLLASAMGVRSASPDKQAVPIFP